MMLANAAIFYAPDGYDINNYPVIGRRVAGQEFIKAFARLSHANALYCCTPTAQYFEHFIDNIKLANKNTAWIKPDDHHALADVGCLFYPDPGIARLSWLRNKFGARSYSLCGLTHTISSYTVMNALSSLFSSPIQTWDAIICTSRAAQHVLLRFLQDLSHFLHQCWGARPALNIHLPIIPLGINVADYCRTPEKDANCKLWRQQLALEENDFVVLSIGRLSFTDKINPIPTYIALNEAAKITGKNFVLLHYGVFHNDAVKSVYQETIKQFCRNVKVLFLDGNDFSLKEKLFAIADIFTSLTDNIQETFGLAPVEAMSAGLPSVVSDWDGYKDTVRHSIDGFRIDSLFPTPPTGDLIADNYAANPTSELTYYLNVSQTTSIDISQAINAFVALAQNPELRKTMSLNAQARAAAQYDWSIIVRQYQELWQELSIRRQFSQQCITIAANHKNPLFDDPFRLFASFPSKVFDVNATIKCLWKENTTALYNFIKKQSIPSFFDKNLSLSDEETKFLLEIITSKSAIIIADLLANSCFEQNKTMFTLGWLCKYGIISISP